MRNLPYVIDQILEVAPDLAAHLEPIKTSCLYTAPEIMNSRWYEAQCVLNTHAVDHEKSNEIRWIWNDIKERNNND